MKSHKRMAILTTLCLLLSAVPSHSYGASSNYLQRSALRVAEGHICANVTTANALRIKFTDHDSMISPNETFYLKLKGAKWSKEALTKLYAHDPYNVAWYFGASSGLNTMSAVKYQYISDTVMEVTLYNVDEKGTYNFPLITEITGEQASVSIDASEGRTVATEGTWVFANALSHQATVNLGGSLKTFYYKGELAPINIVESYVGAMQKGAIFDIELGSNDFDFDLYGSKVRDEALQEEGYITYRLKSNELVQLQGGFYGKDFPIYAQVGKKDKGSMRIIIPETSTASSLGTIRLMNIPVKSNNRTAGEGTLQVDITSSQLAKDVNLSVANIKRYGSYVEMKNTQPSQVIAGHTGEITFSIGEYVTDSMIGGREVELELSLASFDYRTLLQKYGQSKVTSLNLEELSNDEVRKLDPILRIGKLKGSGLIQKQNNVDLIEEMYFAQDASGKINPNKLIVILKDDIEDNDVIDKVTFTLPVYVPIENRDQGRAWLNINGRALDSSASTAAIDIKNPFTIEHTSAVVKVGLQAQKAGNIKIAETEMGMFGKGDLKIGIGDVKQGVGFNDSTHIEVVGDTKPIKLSGDRETKDCVEIQVKRKTSEATSIYVDLNSVNISRTVPEGMYDLEISGEAIDAYGECIKIEDFLVVGTPNTEVLANKGLKATSVKFVIGSKKYESDGEEILLDVAPYIEEPGYTMVPIRYVANAFGVGDQDILYSGHTAILLTPERTIEVSEGSLYAHVNGVPIQMNMMPIVKDDRMYVPIAELAKLMGIQVAWDESKKTATFTKPTLHTAAVATTASQLTIE